jgi:hypothetical protein
MGWGSQVPVEEMVSLDTDNDGWETAFIELEEIVKLLSEIVKVQGSGAMATEVQQSTNSVLHVANARILNGDEVDEG